MKMDDLFTNANLSDRAKAAIALQVPDSGEGWLDDMIRQAIIKETAKEAMQAFISKNDTGLSINTEKVLVKSFQIADAFLQQFEKKRLG